MGQTGVFVGAIRASGDLGSGCGRGNLHQMTSFGADVSPVWNPRTGAQLAFVSGRTGEPQIYVMDQDGANVQRIDDSGYAISPSWSSNGGMLASVGTASMVPGDPGGQDIYVMDIASKKWLQATHEAGNNDFPSWSPDGRHIVFQREINRPHANLVNAVGRDRAAISSPSAATTRCRTGAGK